MNKLIALAAMSALSLAAAAEDGASDLVFKFKDGTEQSIPAKNLQMNIVDGSIEADNGEMSLNIPLANLVQFAFGDNAGIADAIAGQSAWTIYDLEGKRVGVFADLTSCQGHIAAGIYVAKSASTTIKIAIR